MKTFLIERAVRFLMDSLTKVSYDKIVTWVTQAETMFDSGADRKAFVIQQLKSIFGIVTPWILDTLVALAVMLATRKGLINK